MSQPPSTDHRQPPHAIHLLRLWWGHGEAHASRPSPGCGPSGAAGMGAACPTAEPNCRAAWSQGRMQGRGRAGPLVPAPQPCSPHGSGMRVLSFPCAPRTPQTMLPTSPRTPSTREVMLAPAPGSSVEEAGCMGGMKAGGGDSSWGARGVAQGGPGGLVGVQGKHSSRPSVCLQPATSWSAARGWRRASSAQWDKPSSCASSSTCTAPPKWWYPQKGRGAGVPLQPHSPCPGHVPWLGVALGAPIPAGRGEGSEPGRSSPALPSPLQGTGCRGISLGRGRRGG